MLQIKNVHKEYKLGDLTQTALNNVSLDLRDNEFVSILGPSGSGKTTLLNIIGGLDKYDSGDLIIGGVSTKNYKDRDWDTYRNHTVGFIFQSYNLISHQTILSNVELALTIGGISKAERKKRASEALKKVGLGDHLKKKPNQLSGGQMQRVAIARALVNNPDILLADEPTGALDSETSVQIMELLKEVAKEKLVVMVTHNPELAEEYSTRIIKVKDGNIVGDTNEFKADGIIADSGVRNGVKKSKMKVLTSFALSLSNLNTKKKRTLLTAFAGSIGIIGIALILSLSNGVNTYIDDLQKDTMSSYPITISAESVNMSGVNPMSAISEVSPISSTNNDGDSTTSQDESVSTNFYQLESANDMTITNNLAPFKEYLDDGNSEIAQYLGENGVHYSYDTSFSVYAYDANGNLVNTDSDPAELLESSNAFSMQGTQNAMIAMVMGGTSSGASNFTQLPKSSDGSLINESILENYNLVNGNMPQNYDEILLVTDENQSISAETLYQIGLMTADEYENYAKLISIGEEVESLEFTYDEILSHELYLFTNSDKYTENEDGTFTLVSEEELSLNDEVMDNYQPLKIVGIISPKADAVDANISTSFAYTSLLTDYIIEKSNNSNILLAQENSINTNVLTGAPFEAESDEEKLEDITVYLQNMSVAEKADLYSVIMYYSQSDSEDTSTQATGGASMGQVTDEMLATMLDTWLVETPDKEILLGLYDDMLGGTYDENIKNFGKVDYASPSSINIYADSFEDKDGIVLSIANYNENASDENQIIYTDYVESLTSAMTTMVDTISYVLIAFVAVSLIVSCIMVGIITHISVIERTKEIGVLRALGASKSNVSQVFNAETLIIGLCSGLIGIGSALLINIPINSIVQSLLGGASVNVALPISASIALLIVSVVVTVFGGLLPAKKAAQKDPVIALRSE